jgi:PPOX class probable F420-dependent enzyme
MDAAARRERIASARVGRLATVTAAGRPHVVVCCFTLDGDTIYSAIDAKPKSTLELARLDNVRANPVASLLVDYYDDDWSQLWWVRVDGAARVAEDAAERERARALLARKYEQYRDTPPPGAVIALDIETWRAWP